MKFPLIVAAFVILFSPSLVPAQNAADIESKFGTPTKAYLVLENIWMSPSYASDGQVCRIELFAKTRSAIGGYQSIKPYKADFIRALEKLVPELMVPVATTEAVGVQESSGNVIWNLRSYDQISIVFVSGYNFSDDDWINFKPRLKFNERSPSSPVLKLEFLDGFSVRYTSVLGPRYRERVESAVISWKDRKCSDDPYQ